MGFWEHLRYVAAKPFASKPTHNLAADVKTPDAISNGELQKPKDHSQSPKLATQLVTKYWQNPHAFSLAAVIKLTGAVKNGGSQKIKEYLPEPDRRDKIAGAVTNFGKQVVTKVWQTPYNLSLAATLKVSEAAKSENVLNLKDYLPEPNRQDQILRIATNISKFAVDSAIKECLKGLTGGVQVYQIVKEGLKEESPASSSNSDKTKAETLKMKEMEAKMKKMEEEFNNMKAKLEQLSTHKEIGSSGQVDTGSSKQVNGLEAKLQQNSPHQETVSLEQDTCCYEA